jgi:phenylpyruvate tautomerase PptA (4-oxalocrotonate tautomerase family)
MPLIYINCPKSTFNQSAKNKLAEELTNIALHTEKLPSTTFVRSTCWIYFNEITPNNIYKGGICINSGDNIVSLEVNVFKGGLDVVQKGILIEVFTACIRKYLNISDTKMTTVYILIKDIEEEDWGVFGSRITLHDLQHTPEDAEPI